MSELAESPIGFITIEGFGHQRDPMINEIHHIIANNKFFVNFYPNFILTFSL